MVEALREVNFLFLDRPDETLGVAIVPGLALIGYADLDLGVLKDLGIGGIGRGRVLDPLVRMVDLWSGILGQSPTQSDQGRSMVQVAQE